MPVTLTDWQNMFSGIYANQNSEQDPGWIYFGLWEELGELGEAVRLLPFAPEYMYNELADIFAWLMAIANHLDATHLEDQFSSIYGSTCPDCDAEICACPAVPEGDLARQANEVPENVFLRLLGGPQWLKKLLTSILKGQKVLPGLSRRAIEKVMRGTPIGPIE